MTCKFLASFAVVALSTTMMVAIPPLCVSQTTPPMAGGYPNVIAIPVDTPRTKAISGALFKPEGAGPFPAVIIMPGCGGVDTPDALFGVKMLVNHLKTKGIATLVVDPFTPRGQMGCDPGDFGFKDALGALKVLMAMPDIDAKHIFLQGNSWGATASVGLVNKANSDSGDAKFAGVIAYYPDCGMISEPLVPVLVLIGDKDGNVSACAALKDTPNFEAVVYPGAGHGFDGPSGTWGPYDEKATQDAGLRADAFMAAHMK